MANRMYNRAMFRQNSGAIDPTSGGDTFKVMLVDSGYTFDPDDDFVSSGAGTPGGEELSGTGYVAGFGNSGRLTIANTDLTLSDANDNVVFDGDNVTWTGINAGTAAAAIIIIERTNDADSELYAFIDTATPGFPVVTDGSNFTLTWPAAGIVAITSPVS